MKLTPSWKDLTLEALQRMQRLLVLLSVSLAAPVLAQPSGTDSHDHHGAERRAPSPKPTKATPAQELVTKQGALPTQAFRDEHKEVLLHLEHVKEWVGALPSQKPEEQKKSAQRIHKFFAEHIRPHAEWEEKNLYPVIDRLTNSKKDPFTSTMRLEHVIVGRWIDELAAELKKSKPDYVAIARRSDNLLGLLWAHFEEEEKVLLPYVDRSMTREAFEKEVNLEKGHH